MREFKREQLGMRLLMVSDQLNEQNAAGRASRSLMTELADEDVEVIASTSAEDARVIIGSDPAIQCVLLDWDLRAGTAHDAAAAVVADVRGRNAAVPLFLLADRSSISEIPAKVLQDADDFIWLLEDTANFIRGRIVAAIQRYRDQILPPMFSALVRFANLHEYSWHTPGHAGGTAFLKSAVGRTFFDFFGEGMLRSDLSISVGELGSLLDHSGPIGEGERYAARVFGAHRSYTVTNGTSTSNRVVLMASVTRNQVVLCDRNCHKSMEHGMTLSGAIPTYLMPSRNRYGIIGPIHPESLTKSMLEKSIANNPLVRGEVDPTPMHAVITNSTYDGLCYDITRVEALLGQSVDRLHFDEAWYAYARFNPIYRGRFAMHGSPDKHDTTRPTVFATQSTHKLLAALSQASFLHVRDGRRPVEHGRFNEAFMLHASTSPQYAVIASNDVSAAMMDGPGGPALTTESIREAVGFRRVMARLDAEFAEREDWFFRVWQPDFVADGQPGRTVAFHLAAEDLLVQEPACWLLRKDEAWHGFGGLEDGYCMLDPIKVTILTPGISESGGLQASGIPASLVTAYLDRQGVVVEKTTDFGLLFLFSLGVTKGKWGTLVNVLLDFKRDYDANARWSAYCRT